MRKIIVGMIIIMFMGCNLCGESEFAHMPTYEKTLIYSESDIKIYMIEEYDGYITEIYYIDQDGLLLDSNSIPSLVQIDDIH